MNQMTGMIVKQRLAGTQAVSGGKWQVSRDCAVLRGRTLGIVDLVQSPANSV
jgi:hypothetical protein